MFWKMAFKEIFDSKRFTFKDILCADFVDIADLDSRSIGMSILLIMINHMF